MTGKSESPYSAALAALRIYRP
jgi:uncharacterized DUF497 family protein